MTGDRGRVLVLDGDQASSLAIVRSLGRRGITVDVGERSAGFLSSFSRFAGEKIVYPDPLTSADAFVALMKEKVASARYNLIIPVAEDTVQPLAQHRAQFEPETMLAIAPNDALETMLDKNKTFELARSLGIPVPESWTFTDEHEVVRVARAFSFPLVVKPARSIGHGPNGSSGVRKKLSVMYAHDPEQLVALAKSALPSGPVIVQEYFRGAGVGVELLADHGEVVYAFQHKRLHELPLTGGGSCLRESVAVHPMLLEHSKKLIAATKWHGVAMVEFKLDEATDECRLMEVNGRFWGSLPLAVAAGADFPYLLYKLMTEGRRPNAEEAKPAKLGVLCRKLSQDVYWYVQVLSPDQDEPLIKWPSKQEALSDLLLGLSPRHHFDVQSFRDPRPGIVDLGRTAEWFVGRAGAVAKQKLIAYSQARERKSGAFVDQRLKNAREVLFLCYGNINRSVLAARHLQSQLPLQARLRVTSAGFHHEEGRPADPSMVLEAAKHGLSLEASSSRRITAEMLARADVVLAMEIKHLLLMREQFPEAAPKVYLISCAAPADAEVPLEIADPYGNDAAAFARCYREITACTEAIAKGLL